MTHAAVCKEASCGDTLLLDTLLFPVAIWCRETFSSLTRIESVTVRVHMAPREILSMFKISNVVIETSVTSWLKDVWRRSVNNSVVFLRDQLLPSQVSIAKNLLERPSCQGIKMVQCFKQHTHTHTHTQRERELERERLQRPTVKWQRAKGRSAAIFHNFF